MKTKIIAIFSILLLLSSCNYFKSDKTKKLESLNKELVNLNDKLKNEKIVLTDAAYNNILKNKSKEDYSIVVYYDANCSVCFTELKKWKSLIPDFKKVDENLNIKFILHTTDTLMTSINLKNSEFDKELVFYDERNDFLEKYEHALIKAYNTMLLDENNEIIFIGSPLKSNNIKKHYTQLITDGK